MKNRKALLVFAIILSLCLESQAQQGNLSNSGARSVPAWARDGVIYEIYPRAFSAEGNFKGITRRLDDLEELGVTVLWLMPIHPIGRLKKKGSVGSPYAIRDYYAINPDYGAKEDFRRLVVEAHRRGLKVIIDVVANHTSWDSVLMKHTNFYTRDANGRIVSPYDWTDVADLNYDNAQLREYMIAMMKYWLKEFDLDGLRSDVAGEVPTDFWERARAELEQTKPGLLMLAEAYKPELMEKAFDLDYDWPLFHAINDVAWGRKPASHLAEVWEEGQKKFPRGTLHLRFTDNHDERRAIARLGERGALAASAFVLTIDGVPLIYNGMEAGDTTESGAPALFERLPVMWGFAERRREFAKFYRQMIALRRAHPALTRGETHWLGNSDQARVLTYFRRDEGEEFLIAINLSNRPFAGSVEVAQGASFTEVISNSIIEGNQPQSHSSLPSIEIAAWGFRIFRRALK